MLIAMTSGECWTLALIIVLVLVCGVCIVSDDTDWFA